MKVILQVFTGFRRTSAFHAEKIIDRIEAFASVNQVDKIIIGWCTDKSVYREVGSFLHNAGIQMLLWLPVFSGTIGNTRPDQAKDLFGRPFPIPRTEDEASFHFVCPSSGRNIRIVENTYEEFFSDCGFDGVFLDRIRGRSFAAGVPGVLSCGCERCSKAFLEKGVDIDKVRELYDNLGDAFFDIASWPADGAFVLENPAAQRFLTAREEIIAEAVIELTGYFRNRGLIVGLDLFAPVISRLVGQNYALITKDADFIKPMLYRRTNAPAGIGYEYSLFDRQVPEARGKITLSLNRAFLDSQLRAIRSLPCEKYPGIEINYDRELVKTDDGYIRESLAAVREHGFDGATLCWNIMTAPDGHIVTVEKNGLS